MLTKDFMFGVSTSSYQIEGTHNKFKSIWDKSSKNIINQQYGEIACDFYNRYVDDIQLIKTLGVDVYRMSLSWARIQPTANGFSEEGVEFYRQVLKQLKKQGILVDLTLYHWDMPLWIYNKGVGFDHPLIVDYFFDYAKKVFQEFDQYVHRWATFNEPWCVSRVGYLMGEHAPFEKNPQKAYQADYYQLIAHKKVYDYYKQHYNSDIGIVINVWGSYPLTDSKEDKQAAFASSLFFERSYLDPLFKGIYNKQWINYLEDIKIDLRYMDLKALKDVKDSTDFLGINYYNHLTVVSDRNHPLGFKPVQTGYPLTDMNWEINPNGLRKILETIRNEYTNIPIVITENGIALKDELHDGIINDEIRTQYIQDHFDVIEAISESHNIIGYYVWSLLDNFEWQFGYTKRFGLIYVDYDTMKRIPKNSYYAYKDMIEKKRLL